MPESEGSLERRSAQVEVTVLGAKVFASITVFLYGKWRSNRLVKYVDTLHFNLNFSGRNLGVLALTLKHFSADLNHIFTTQRLGLLVQFRVSATINYELGDAVAVTKVDECHSTEFAGFLNPSREGDFLSFVGKPQLTASIASVHSFGNLRKYNKKRLICGQPLLQYFC